MRELFKDAVIFVGGLVYGLLSAFLPWTLAIAVVAGGLIGKWEPHPDRWVTRRSWVRVSLWALGSIVGLGLYAIATHVPGA